MKGSKRRFKSKHLVSLVALAMLSLPLTVHAETSEESVSVMGGGLKVTQSKVTLNDVHLSVKSAQTTTGSSELLINDSRGSGAGWSVSVKSTDFTMSKELQGQTKTFTLPANAVRFTAKVNSVISGDSIPFGTGDNYLAANTTMTNTPSKVIQAGAGQGMGAYRVGLDYTVYIPETITANSGETLGVLEGTYRATFTFTSVSGI